MPTYPDCIPDQFRRQFGYAPTLVVRAPGRINLIGEHTDYNLGFVLPAAIDKAIYFAAAARPDDTCRFYAQNPDELYTGSVGDLQKSAAHPWANYLLGVISELQRAGHAPEGVDLVFGGDIPLGAGLSSSAALESGMAFVLNRLFGLNIDQLEQVRFARLAENRFVGLQCGIMDMFASIMGRKNACIKLDCRDLSYEYLPFDAPDHTLVLCDTGVKHALVDSEYNTRQAECQQGVRILQAAYPDVRSLRDATPDMVFAEKNKLGDPVFRRCRYVVEENERVNKACLALKNNDFQSFGQLLYETHDGLQHLYEVSCPELDFLVDAARPDPAVPGSRMMGGGFGGCTINLVEKHAAADFIRRMQAAYLATFNHALKCYEVAPSEGVHAIG